MNDRGRAQIERTASERGPLKPIPSRAHLWDVDDPQFALECSFHVRSIVHERVTKRISVRCH